MKLIMRGKLSPGIDKAGRSVGTLRDKAEQVSKNITDRIAAQKKQTKHVEFCLKGLKKQYDDLVPGKTRLKVHAEMDAYTKALQKDKNIPSSPETEHSRVAIPIKRPSI